MIKQVDDKPRRLAFRSKNDKGKGKAKPVRIVTKLGEPLKVTSVDLVPKEPVKQPAKSPTELLITGGLELLAGGIMWFFDNYRIVHK